jgi:hypothetical protein
MAPAADLGIATAAWRRDAYVRSVVSRTAVLFSVLAVAALTSSTEDWQPVSLIGALAVLMLAADTAQERG